MLFEKFTSGTPIGFASEDEFCEELKSALIVSFEKAIDRGVQPARAIATILEWTSEEMARLQEEQLQTRELALF